MDDDAENEQHATFLRQQTEGESLSSQARPQQERSAASAEDEGKSGGDGGGEKEVHSTPAKQLLPIPPIEWSHPEPEPAPVLELENSEVTALLHNPRVMQAWRAFTSALPEIGDGPITPDVVGDSLLRRFLAA